MKRDQRQEVALQNKPVAVTDPRASAYQQKLAARKASVPRGGDIELPNIPRFDQEPPENPMPIQVPGIGGLYHSDMLPDAAKQDPRYVQGQGSELAVNQPHLAFQYGVTRNGRYIPPADLKPGQQPQQPQQPGVVGTRRALRPETIEGIETLKKLEQKKREAEEAAQEEEDAANATSTARLAGEVEDKKEEEDTKKALQDMDDLDFYNFTQAMMRDLINNGEQRKIIESRLEPIDITDLITMDRFEQKVQVVPDKFEPIFETIGGRNDLAMKKLIAEEARELNINERYLLDKFAMMQLAAGVKAIGSVQMPEYRDSSGLLVPELFWKRFNKLSSLPTPVLASLGANFFWFDVRCRKACTAKELKNG